MQPENIRAVFFDLDGTLRHNQPPWARTFDDYIAGLEGVTDSPENRKRAARWDHYYWANSPELLLDIERFGEDKLSFRKNHIQRRLVAFGCLSDQAKVLTQTVFQHLHANFHPVDSLPPDVHLTLETLRENGLFLAVVSNRLAPVDDLLAELGLRDYFQHTLASSEVNSWKPDAAIFQRALAHAGTYPEQTVYVGDNYFADVVGARNARLWPVLLDPGGIFPDPGCPVIHELGDLIKLLGFTSKTGFQ